MEGIHHFLTNLLPFSWLQYEFMQNAFLAVLIITPLFGLLGTMVVNNKMAFFSDALGHSALTGIAIGVVFGISTNASMILFGILFALLLDWIGRKNLVSSDTLISVFSSLSIALGLAVLSRGGDFGKYSGLLVGDILSISEGEILRLFMILILTWIFWCLCFNKLHSMSISRLLARTKGIRVRLLEDLFSILIAVVVMLSIRWVGILIINALLILPAASARNLAENVREYHFFSVLFSVFSGILGLILSYYINVASGPAIIIVASVVFFGSYLWSEIT